MVSSTSDFAGYRIDAEFVIIRPQTETAMIWAMANFVDNGCDSDELRFVIPNDQFSEAVYTMKAAGFSIVIEVTKK